MLMLIATYSGFGDTHSAWAGTRTFVAGQADRPEDVTLAARCAP